MRLATLALTATLWACQTQPAPPDDAGDAQWVLQALPTLLGRNAKSLEEVQVLVDLVQNHDRETAARAIMERPEFDRYWALVLIEAMDFGRGGEDVVARSCLTDELGMAATYPNAFFEPMTDLLADEVLVGITPGMVIPSEDPITYSVSRFFEAAVHVDRLDFVAAAHMPIRASNYHNDNTWTARDKFLKTVINRDVNCMGCHNGAWSTTDDPLAIASGWDRTWVLNHLAPEGNLFDHTGSNGFVDGMFAPRSAQIRAANLFQTNGWSQTSPTSVYDLHSSCFERHLPNGVTRYIGPPPGFTADSAFAGLGANSTVVDLSQQFLSVSGSLGGGSNLGTHHFRVRAYDPSSVASPTSPVPPSEETCRGCHGSSNGSGYDPGFAEIPDERIRQVLRGESVPQAMLQMIGPSTLCSTSACVEQKLGMIRHGVSLTDGTSIQGVPYADDLEYATPEVAFGMSVALQMVDHIVEEIGGSRLMLSHGYARNQATADLQRELAYTLVDANWSLRELLVFMVTSDSFNREAPAVSASLSGESAYVLPPIARPFAQLPPGTSAQVQDNLASLGESVHRHSIPHLTEKVHHALGWPSTWAPGTDTNAVYPTPSYLDGLGRYVSDREPGWNQPVLPTLATWESMMGTCQKPVRAVLDPQLETTPGLFSQPVYALELPLFGATWTDWVDVLVEDTVAEQHTVGIAAALLRERLLQSPIPGPAEGSAFEVLASEHGLQTQSTVTAGQADDLEDVLRSYCGALVTSPQFMLGGLSTEHAEGALMVGGLLPERPAFQLPTPATPDPSGGPPLEPSGHAGWCADYGYVVGPDGSCR